MIELQVFKRFPGLILDVHCTLPAGITVITGPSGSGKSTLLKMVAGLLRPEHGVIQLGGQRVFDHQTKLDLPAHQRNLGFVFQEDRLFPHLSVKANLLFGAPKRPDRLEKMHQLATLLGVSALLNRRPFLLSGGERQRVSIGRALLREPCLLLLDEPLSSLDTGRKEALIPYINQLSQTQNIPILYVTHDESEAAQLAQARLHLEPDQGYVKVRL